MVLARITLQLCAADEGLDMFPVSTLRVTL